MVPLIHRLHDFKIIQRVCFVFAFRLSDIGLHEDDGGKHQYFTLKYDMYSDVLCASFGVKLWKAADERMLCHPND